MRGAGGGDWAAPGPTGCLASCGARAAPLRQPLPLALLRAAPLLQIKVCVIDSGVRPTHEDLAGNVVGGWNRCVGAGRRPQRRAGRCMRGATVRAQRQRQRKRCCSAPR